MCLDGVGSFKKVINAIQNLEKVINYPYPDFSLSLCLCTYLSENSLSTVRVVVHTTPKYNLCLNDLKYSWEHGQLL